MDLHPWDTAAGLVILEEAGGQVTDFTGESLLGLREADPGIEWKDPRGDGLVLAEPMSEKD